MVKDIKQSQPDKFKEAARQLGTDDDDGRIEEQLKKLSKQKTDTASDNDAADK